MWATLTCRLTLAVSGRTFVLTHTHTLKDYSQPQHTTVYREKTHTHTHKDLPNRLLSDLSLSSRWEREQRRAPLPQLAGGGIVQKVEALAARSCAGRERGRGSRSRSVGATPGEKIGPRWQSHTRHGHKPAKTVLNNKRRGPLCALTRSGAESGQEEQGGGGSSSVRRLPRWDITHYWFFRSFRRGRWSHREAAPQTPCSRLSRVTRRRRLARGAPRFAFWSKKKMKSNSDKHLKC